MKTKRSKQDTEERRWIKEEVEALNYFLQHEREYHEVLDNPGHRYEVLEETLPCPSDLNLVNTSVLWIESFGRYVIICGVTPNGYIRHWIGGKEGSLLSITKPLKAFFCIEDWKGFNWTRRQDELNNSPGSSWKWKNYTRREHSKVGTPETRKAVHSAALGSRQEGDRHGVPQGRDQRGHNQSVDTDSQPVGGITRTVSSGAVENGAEGSTDRLPRDRITD